MQASERLRAEDPPGASGFVRVPELRHPTNRGRVMSSRFRRAGLTLAALVALGVAGCGGNDDDKDAAATPAGARRGHRPERHQGLPARAHRAPGRPTTGTLRADAEAYYKLAEEADFDYAKLLDGQAQRRAPRASRSSRRTSPTPTRPTRRWRASSPACPSLADYDVIIDAGGDASDPENAVPVLGQDARRAHLQAARATSTTSIETSRLRHRAEVRRQGRQARPRRRRQGRVRRGAARRRLLRRRGARLRGAAPRSSTRPPASGARRSRTRSPRWS